MDVRKPNTKWSALRGLDPHRSRAGSHLAPLRSPGQNRAAKKQTIGSEINLEWLDEWAGGGSVIGEPSSALGGSVPLTLESRERKRRDSHRGQVDKSARKSR